MKKKAVNLDTLAEDVLIEEIRDGDVEEVSGVDRPAIARGFTGFKRAGGKPRASKTFKRPPVDAYEACLARGNQPTPGSCEGGQDEESMIREVLDPDYAGHDFEHDYAHAKAVPEGADPAVFDRCLEDVMAAIDAGDLVPDDPDADPKETAYAICSAGDAGKCEGARAMKSEEHEIPAPPTQCDRDDCMEIAGEMGLSAEQAEATYEAVRTDYGAPWEDPNLILVPKDLEPEDLVASAAQSLGFVEAKGMPKVKLKGRSHWADGIRSFLGMPNRTPAAKALASELKAMRRAQEAIVADHVKTKDDLKDVLKEVFAQSAADRRLFARALGIDPADIEAPAAIAPAAVPEPALSVIAGKRLGRKDVTPTATAEPAAVEGDEALAGRVDRIEAALVEQGTALQQILGALGATETPGPAKRASQPPPIASGRRFSGTKAATGEHFESFTGLPVSQAERAAVWASQGVQRLGAK